MRETSGTPASTRGVVLVTGGSAGIGRAFAEEFAALGRDLLLVARSRDRLAEAQAAITARHPVDVQVLALDITDREAEAAIDDALASNKLHVDVLVNNAGRLVKGPLVALDAAELRATLDLNVTAIARLAHHFLPGMIARGHGGIIFLSSLAGQTPLPTLATYAASKTFVRSFAEAMRVEVAEHGVTVTVVSPGPVRTDLFDAGFAEDATLLARLTPTLSAATVARIGVNGFLTGQAHVAPGLANAIAQASMRIIPQRFARAVGRLLIARGEDDGGTVGRQ